MALILPDHIRVFDCEQGTDDWFDCRKGIPTASQFKDLMTKGRGANTVSLVRLAYLDKLAAEIITGKPTGEGFKSAGMERGTEQEPDARIEYAFRHNVEPTLVGFVRNDNLRCGCSPDALIGADGAAEFKSALPHIQIKRFREATLPKEHVEQVQGSMMVLERDYWDFASYCPALEKAGLDMFEVRVYRDDIYIAELKEQVERFNEELIGLLKNMRDLGAVRKAA
jgi:hypothetical protein